MKVVDFDKMQYRFMPGRKTVDTMFVLRRLLFIKVLKLLSQLTENYQVHFW